VIRPARPDDYEALRDIERAAGALFREIGMAAIADAEPYDADELAAAAAVLVATGDDDAPIGYAMIEIVDGHAHLGQVSVLPDQGGRGIGTQLLDAVAAWASERGHPEVTLTTFRDVPFNAPLYAKRGYGVVPTAELTRGLRDLVAHEAELGLDPTTRVVMRRELQ
jgi:GNAT superfamily N-acetyltransferase